MTVSSSGLSARESSVGQLASDLKRESSNGEDGGREGCGLTSEGSVWLHRLAL